MKKILLFLLFLIISSNLFAQLDREHWFAPMVDRTGNPNQVQRLYMSTNETTPFKVEIYNNNTLIGSVTISKNNPAKYDVTRSYIIAANADDNDLFKPGTRGLYLKGERTFYASLRFSVSQHGEILTSKGTSGIGTEFRAVMAPITAENYILNFMTSVLATEDNTNVTINGFSPTLYFSDGVTRTQFTFKLNKGESYIIDGSGDYTQNATGFIGAKIVSDKPISITNGNFNGQYATTATNSSDILMDQGVPTDKLGQEFIVMKGNGTIASGMEKAIIVANEDNTQIYLNGSGTPSATINAGQFFMTPNSAYTNTSSNIHIKTTKNAYVYQLLAGDDGDSMVATGGFNYIPPLSCYLPKKIDEIGLIDENRVFISNENSYRNNIPTKLNIITEKDASIEIKRNGVTLPLSAANGPFSVRGTNSWVTYSYPDITGNVAVFSSSAVTAGISAGDNAVGYGGYFAGFSFIPAIIKQEGDCLPGVKLAVTEGFTSYQWLIKDNAGNYVAAPGVNNTNVYEPPQAGIYSVKIQQGSCPAVQTQDFKFYNCTTYTNVNYETCSTVDVTPAFSLSTQTLNPVTVKIETPPTKGTVVIGANGIIKYTANPNTSGVDTFKFSYCGNNAIPDCETAQATIQVNQIVGQDAILRECTTTTTAVYDLSKANVTADASASKKYYKTLVGAQNETAADEITAFTAFSSPDVNVYVRIKNAKSCFATFKIELKRKAFPVVQENLYTTTHCDEEDGKLDGNYVVDLNTITPVVLANASTFTVTYYDAANNVITGNYSFTTATSQISIKVESAEGCITTKPITLKIGNKIPLITNNLTLDVCDKGFDNTEAINLANYIPQFTAASGVTATYYASMADALSMQNPINVIQNINMGTVGSFYYVIKNASFCSDVSTLNLKLIMGGQASTTLPASPVTVCVGATTNFDAGSAHSAYKWYNDNDPTTVIGTTQKITLGVGKYFVVLVSANGCEYKQFVEVIGSPKVILNTAALNSVYCDDDFDGKINVSFSKDVTPVILATSPVGSYKNVSYYTNNTMTGAPLPDDWTFTVDTKVYLKITSEYCGDTTGILDFKIGNKLSLLTTSAPQTICDILNDGTEVINLDSYKNLFLNATDMGIVPKYYTNLSDAQKNINPLPSGGVTLSQATISYFYRFEKTGVCPNIGELKIKFSKGFPSTTLPTNNTITICETATTQLDAGTAHTSYKWYNVVAPTVVIGTNPKITLPPGKYFVVLTSSDGCDYKQEVEVVASKKANLDVSKLNATNCDEDFDGLIKINFATDVTSKILLNNSNVFTVEYYSGNLMTPAQLLPNAWSYSADTTVYVKVKSLYCPDVSDVINFKIGAKIPVLKSTETQPVCDDNLDGIKLVKNLDDFKILFTTDPTVKAKFYLKKADAEANASSNITEINVNKTQTLYVRLSNATQCSALTELKIDIKVPTESLLIKDQTICPSTTTVVNAGPGFTKYDWYKEDAPTVSIGSTDKITLGVGNYFVILTAPNGCDYKQSFKISEFELPTIESIEINGSTVVVKVKGGTAPYKYALNNGSYQDSNTFLDVTPGLHTVQVISVSDNCAPVSKPFSVIKIYNFISPNGDGVNDVLDMSLLQYKVNVKFQVYDRAGKKLFDGDTKNNYTWDGKENGKTLSTSSYWYVMEWQDFENSPPVKYTGWILLKNRNSD